MVRPLTYGLGLLFIVSCTSEMAEPVSEKLDEPPVRFEIPMPEVDTGWPCPPFSGNTEPGGNTDSDGDSLTDCQEEILGTNPEEADSDGDNLPDNFEVTDNLLKAPDTDKDGLIDAVDDDDDGDSLLTVEEDVDGNGSVLNDDTDGDKIPNYRDSDDDGDRVLTILELPIDKDTDGDNVPDYLDNDDDDDCVPTRFEDVDGSGDFTDDDTDGDSIPNFHDDDDDGDGIPTCSEVPKDSGLNPRNFDADCDGIPEYLDTHYEIPDPPPAPNKCTPVPWPEN